MCVCVCGDVGGERETKKATPPFWRGLFFPPPLAKKLASNGLKLKRGDPFDLQEVFRMQLFSMSF